MATKHKKSQTIFNDDNVIVEQNDSVDMEPKRERRAMSVSNGKTVLVTDYIDALMGFCAGQVSSKWNTERHGTCILCGADTMYTTRKICLDCFANNNEQLYNNCKEAVERGESSYTIEYKAKDNGD